MVFTPVLYYVFAIGIFMITIFVITPLVDDFWYNHLEDMVAQNQYHDQNVSNGRLYAAMFLILCYASAGILIAWGYSTAARKGTSEEQEQY